MNSQTQKVRHENTCNNMQFGAPPGPHLVSAAEADAATGGGEACARFHGRQTTHHEETTTCFALNAIKPTSQGNALAK